MIQIIFGLMNCGKTLFLSYKLFIDYLKGRTIYANFDLTFPHIRINRDTLIKWAKEQPLLENCSIGLDEIWLMIDSRRSFANTIISYFFLQSSKGDTLIYGTSQANNQYDLRLRSNLHLITKCERRLLLGGKYRKITDEIRDLKEMAQFLYIRWITYKHKIVGLDTIFKKKDRGNLFAPPIFNLYDTKQKQTGAHL